MPNNNILVAPSILAADHGRFAEEMRAIEQAGADWLHIDVMDGAFVPPITFGAKVTAVARSATALFLDAHLMVVHPERHIEPFIEAGAGLVTIHVEATAHAHRLLSHIRARGAQSGISLNPGTPVSSVLELLEAADVVLVMSVNPGWSGQKFIQGSVRKIEELRREIDRRGLHTKIQVDGGINDQTARTVVEAGADVLVAGDYVFGRSDRKAAIESLKRA